MRENNQIETEGTKRKTVDKKEEALTTWVCGHCGTTNSKWHLTCQNSVCGRGKGTT